MAVCKENECSNEAIIKGWCNKHYLKFYKQQPDYKPVNKDNPRTKNKLYWIWWQRNDDGVLADEWKDFDTFIKDVGTRPSEDHYLIRTNQSLPYGPLNFKWQLHLKKSENESNREWWARKRKSRIEGNPALESDRNLKRKYGMTREQYNAKLEEQNFVCYICKEPETSVDGRTNKVKNLAVDHCHETEKVRNLLCWRCNTTLGRLKENLDLFKKMITYLEKHKEP